MVNALTASGMWQLLVINIAEMVHSCGYNLHASSSSLYIAATRAKEKHWGYFRLLPTIKTSLLIQKNGQAGFAILLD
jgi:hypothetical protein